MVDIDSRQPSSPVVVVVLVLVPVLVDPPVLVLPGPVVPESVLEPVDVPASVVLPDVDSTLSAQQFQYQSFTQISPRPQTASPHGTSSQTMPVELLELSVVVASDVDEDVEVDDGSPVAVDG